MTSSPLIGCLGALALGTSARLKPCLAASRKPLLSAWHWTDLTGQSYLAEGHHILGQGFILKAGDYGQSQGQVGAGFVDPDAAHHVDKDVLVVGGDPTVPVQYGQQHGQPVSSRAPG